jgi:hypothetical protein
MDVFPIRPSAADAEISLQQAMAPELWAAISQGWLWQHQGKHAAALGWRYGVMGEHVGHQTRETR